MHVIIQSKTLAVTQALKNFIQQQAGKLIRTGQQIQKITVMLESVKRKKNDTTSAKVKFHIGLPGRDVIVIRHAKDMYAAVVDTADRAAQYLVKKKERKIRVKRGKVLDWTLPQPDVSS